MQFCHVPPLMQASTTPFVAVTEQRASGRPTDICEADTTTQCTAGRRLAAVCDWAHPHESSSAGSASSRPGSADSGTAFLIRPGMSQNHTRPRRNPDEGSATMRAGEARELKWDRVDFEANDPHGSLRSEGAPATSTSRPFASYQRGHHPSERGRRSDAPAGASESWPQKHESPGIARAFR